LAFIVSVAPCAPEPAQVFRALSRRTVMRVFGDSAAASRDSLAIRPLPCAVGACQCRRVQALLATDVFGRHAELSALRAFVAADRRVGALLLIGAAGIGKTALWGAALRMARASGRFVMAARPAGAEAGMAFSGLIDLCDRLGAEVLADIPAPQRTALEVALRREEPPRGAAPDAHAIALAFLNVLRRMAADQPLVVAIDDVPWLDPLSVSVLTFAARRLGDEPVTFLLARRPGSPSPLELELAPERVEVGALQPSALRRLLASRLAVFPSPVLLRRIIDVSQGNALFALELGRSIRRAGSLASSPYITLPDTVEDALGARTVALAPGVRRLLLAVALTGGLRRGELEAVAGQAAVEAAFDDGVLIPDGYRVRASHPLLAAAAVKQSEPPERRALHVAIAGAVTDKERSALHLALATDGPDDPLAARVMDAASLAAARGARPQAVVLAEHAVRLTPVDKAEISERLLTLAAYLSLAGERQRMTDLLSSARDTLPAGTPVARAWLLLSDAPDVTTLAEYERRLELVLAEKHVDPAVRAEAVAKRTTGTAVVAVRRVPEAQRWAREALATEHGVDEVIERRLLYSLSWTTALRGRPVDDMCRRFGAVSSESVFLVESPQRVAAQRLVWRGELDAARAALARLLEQADDQGEALSYALHRLHLCELELRVGDWDAAQRLLDEWGESGERELVRLPMYERCRALLAMGRGHADQTRHWAARAISGADTYGDGWDRLEALRARGIAALLTHEPSEAHADLAAVHEHIEREGVGDPGVFPVAPELVEALVDLGDVDRAGSVTARLTGRAHEQAHPWGLATARRCSALIRLAAGRYDRAAGADLADAATELERLGFAFDSARCHLSLGRAQRRLKQWGRARTSLERATEAFAQLGSPGWVQRAKADLARVGGRSPAAPGTLTPTEHDVVKQAAQGLTNKEIARQLSIAVHTVEVHLSRAYVKLGVRCRSQLSAQLTPRPPDPTNP
jgi:DNA-binding CsgD family transcriptional regulator